MRTYKSEAGLVPHRFGKAVAVLMDLSADERTRMIDEEHEKYRRDWASRMKGAEQRGRLEGEQQKQQEIARNALQRGITTDIVQQITGLSIGEIERL